MVQAIPDFEINERVRVRSWADMAAEFGVISGDIYGNDNVCFGAGEAWQCGMEFTVARIEWEGDHYEYYPSLEDKTLLTNDGRPWMFAGWMLEPADRPQYELELPPISDLLEFLGGVA